jgi:hypothetical protein
VNAIDPLGYTLVRVQGVRLFEYVLDTREMAEALRSDKCAPDHWAVVAVVALATLDRLQAPDAAA